MLCNTCHSMHGWATQQTRPTIDISIRREEPEAPTALGAEWSPGACGVLSVIQMIGWPYTPLAAIIQTIVSLDRWSAVCVRSHIQLFGFLLVLGAKTCQCQTSVRWRQLAGNLIAMAVKHLPTLGKFCNVSMSWHVLPRPFQYFKYGIKAFWETCQIQRQCEKIM